MTQPQSRDWKFILTFLAGIAGVAVPIWLWQADLAAKSVSATITSSISLSPSEKESPAELEISIEGRRLIAPHLTVVELRNDGSKPISATDFEGPIEIKVESPASFAKARISSRSPTDLEAQLNMESQRIMLQPLLLNPKDSLRIAAVTSGAPPKFSSKIRIAGVSSASLLDASGKRKASALHWLVLGISLLLLITSMMMVNGATERTGVHLRQRAAAYIGLITLVPATVGIMFLLSSVGIEGFWYFMLVMTLASSVAALIGLFINRQPPQPKGGEP